MTTSRMTNPYTFFAFSDHLGRLLITSYAPLMEPSKEYPQSARYASLVTADLIAYT